MAHRRTAPDRIVLARRRHHRRRKKIRSTSDPSRLRFSFRECGIRRSRRKRGHRFHRAISGFDEKDGIESGRERTDGGAQRACRSRLYRRRPGSERAGPRSIAHRISTHDKGRARRRRQRHAHRACGGRIRSVARIVSARSEKCVRARSRAARTLCRNAAAYRVSDIRRQARQHRALERARMFRAAALSESVRGNALAVRHAGTAREDGRCRDCRGPRARLCECGNGRVHRRADRRFLFHGDQYTAAGRASRHRNDAASRSRRIAVARRVG